MPVVDFLLTDASAVAVDYQVGGSLRLDADSYIRRRADDTLYQALLAGEYCYVFNARQMGKSSLRVRMQQQLTVAGKRCASLDMTGIGSERITPMQWYKGMVVDLLTKFDLRGKLDFKQWWQAQESLPLVQRLRLFIEEILLRYMPDDDILIFVDEIDSALALDFSVDDFFALVRFCYNQRAENSAYARLTWSLFGVVSPSDLISDQRRTPFNVGRAIELKGLAFEDARPLATGLAGFGYDETALLQEILAWTNGQPFLTQKLCWLTKTSLEDLDISGVREEGPVSNTPTALIEQVVYERVIDHWESQDDPEHLRTIRDRLLRNNLKAPRLLGIYETVLTSAIPLCEIPVASNQQDVEAQTQEERAIAYDDSPEHFELLLSGLIGLYQGRLSVKNKIYETVFDLSWVREQLGELRPYAKPLSAWVNSGCKDDSRLLRGRALKDAQAWSQERSVGELDHDFLMASERYDRKITQDVLKSARLKEVEKRLAVVRQSRQKQLIFIGALSGALAIATTLGIVARMQYWRSLRSQLNAMATSAEALYSSDQRLDALLQAIKAEQSFQDLGDQFAPELQDRLDGILRTAAVNVIERNRLTLEEPSAFWAVDVDSTNRYYATGNARGEVHLWSADGQLLHTLLGHEKRIRAVRFFPDGQHLISASADRNIKLWTADGQLVRTLRGHTDVVTDVAVSPTDDTLVSGSSDHTVKLWRKDGTLLKTFLGHVAPVTAVAISPDGDTIASAGEDLSIRLWSRDGELLKTFRGHTGAVVDIDFSAGGSMLASASRDSTIRYWNVETGEQLQTLQNHESDVLAINFSPDGKQLVSSSRDKTLRLWNLKGELIDTLRGHQSRVWAVRFSPDSERIISASSDKTARVWDLTNPLQTRFLGPSAGIIGIDANSDASLIAAASDDKELYVWSRKTGRLLRRFRHQDAVLTTAFSPDDLLLATGSWDGSARLWSLDGEPQAVLSGHTKAVWEIAFSPDGQTIATAGADNKVRLWDRQGQLKDVFSGHSGEVRSVAFSPDGQFLLSASLDETVKLWDVEGRILRIFKGDQQGSEGGFIDASFSPDGTLVAAAGFDNIARIWTVDDGELKTTIEGHEAEVRSARFSEEGSQVVTAGGDGQVKIWTPDGELVATLAGEGEAVWEAMFVEGDRTVIAAGESNQAVLWNLDSVLSEQGLVKTSCQWTANYLETSMAVESDRDLCQAVLE